MAQNPPLWTDQDTSRLKELRALGWSQRELAAELKKTRSSISSKIARLELPLPPRPAKAILPEPPPVKPKRKRAEITGDPVPFLETEPWHCRALFDGRGPNGEVMCCGMPVISGRSWCQPHCEMFFHPLQPPNSHSRSSHGKTGYRV